MKEVVATIASFDDDGFTLNLSLETIKVADQVTVFFDGFEEDYTFCVDDPTEYANQSN